jgi:hypothetical protein
MKILFILFFTLTSLIGFGQCFGLGEWTESYNFSDYLKLKDTVNISYYELESPEDSIVPKCKCLLTKLSNGVIKAQYSNNGKRKIEKAYLFYDEAGYVWHTNNKGSQKSKENYTDFYTVEIVRKDQDSIVNNYHWNIQKNDTLCHSFSKTIYENGKKIEFWETFVILGNKSNSWESIKEYRVYKYSYPSDSIRVIEKYRIDQNRDTTYRNKAILEYDKSFNLKSAKYCNSNQYCWEKLYFYENGLLIREEGWSNGRLDEILKFD